MILPKTLHASPVRKHTADLHSPNTPPRAPAGPLLAARRFLLPVLQTPTYPPLCFRPTRNSPQTPPQARMWRGLYLPSFPGPRGETHRG